MTIKNMSDVLRVFHKNDLIPIPPYSDARSLQRIVDDHIEELQDEFFDLKGGQYDKSQITKIGELKKALDFYRSCVVTDQYEKIFKYGYYPEETVVTEDSSPNSKDEYGNFKDTFEQTGGGTYVGSSQNTERITSQTTYRITSDVDDSARGLRDRLDNALDLMRHSLVKEGYIVIRPAQGAIDELKPCHQEEPHGRHNWYVAMSDKPGSQAVWFYTCLGVAE